MEIFDIKYGDKLYCKKKYNKKIKKGDVYAVREMEIIYSHKFPNGYCSVGVCTYIDEYEEEYVEFNIEELRKYFYTKKELRKIKLDEIKRR